MTQAKILIVEFETVVAGDIRKQLVQLGYEPVANTARGEDAIQLAGQLRPDLVLMGIHLAGEIDGIVAAQAIRDQFALPVVFLTALLTEEMLHRAKLAEPFGFLSKPFDERQLRMTIEVALYNHQAERKVQAREERHQAILQTAMDGFWLANLDGRLLEVNATYCRMSGYCASELLAMTISDLEIRETAAGTASHIQRVIAQGEDRFESQHRRKDGSVFDVEISVQYQSADGGRFVAFLRDVTEQKQAQAALLASRQLLQDTLDTMNAFVGVFTPDGVCVVSNRLAYEAAGLQREDVVGQPFAETKLWNHSPAVQEQVGNALHRAAQGEIVRDDFVSRGAGGKLMTMDSTFGSVRDPLGRVTHVVASGVDVTARKQAEAALRESESRFRAVLENMSLLGVMLDPTGCITMCNDFLLALTDWQRNEVLGRNWFELFLPLDIRERIHKGEFLRSIGDGTIPTRFENEIVTRSGERRTVAWSNTVLRDTTGAVVGTASIGEDITERQRAGQALRDAHWRLASIIEGTRVGTWEWNVQTGATVFNEKWAEVIGYTLEELAPISIKTWERLGHADDLKQSAALLERHFAGELPDYDCECRMKHKDGHWVWVHDRGRVITRTSDGQALMMFGTHADITERKQAEESLRLDNQIMANMADGVYLIRQHDGLIVYANDRFEKMFGYAPGELLGQPVSVVNAPSLKSQEETAQEIIEELDRNGVWEGEVNNIKKDGTTFWCEARVTAFAHGRYGSVWLALHHDITERKQAEAALRESEAKFKAMVETLPLAIHLTVGIEQITQYVNPTMVKWFGYTEEDIPSVAQWWPLAYPDETYRQQVAEEWTARVKHALATQSPIEPMEVVVTCKDGSKKNISWGYITLGDKNYSCGLDLTERKRAEDTANREQALSKAIIDSIPGAFYVLDENGRYARWNSYQCDEIIGQPEALVAGMDAGDTIHPDDRPLIQSRIANVLGRGLDEIVEGRVLLRGGPAFRWLLMTGRQMIIEGRPFLVGIGIDITERKQVEEALQESHRRLELALQGGQLGIWDWEPQAGAVTYSDLWVNMLEYSPDEIKPSVEFFNEHIHPEDMLAVLDRLHGHLEGRTAIYESEHRLRTKSGRWLWVLDRGKVVQRDKDGRPVRVTGIISDIGVRKQAEIERERLTTAIQKAAETVLVSDAQGCIVYVNPSFEALTGYTRAEVLGRNPRILKSGVHDEAFYRTLWGTISSGKTWHGRLVNRKKDGTLFTEEATISPVRDAAGIITSYVGVKRDISRDLALEAQLLQSQKMDSIGRLAGGVAHDFNNILSVILGCAQFVLEDLPESNPLRLDILEIEKAGRRAASLTRQLLAFSRKQVLRPVPLDLNSVLVEMKKMLQRLIGEDIDLVQLLSPNLGQVKADPGQIEQVIMNLAVNARDAMPQGGKLTIETSNVELDEEYIAQHPGAAPGPHATISVSDSGVGMDAKTMARLFEPFFTTKALGKGTGLGLATVYGIVKQSGGSIYVSSEQGVGTTFKVHLPQKSSPTPVVDAPLAVVRSGGTETVLVVEDDEAVRNVAKRILEGGGYVVLTAANGREALLACERYQAEIHLVLTDVVMPEMGGRVFVDHLAQFRRGFKVLYMSGYTDNAIVHHGILDRGTHLVCKPLTRVELLRTVRDVLDGP